MVPLFLLVVFCVMCTLLTSQFTYITYIGMCTYMCPILYEHAFLRANDGWALQPIVGQAYKVTSAVGDSPHLLMLSAGVSFIPPIKYSRLRKQNKKIPADSFLSAVKVSMFVRDSFAETLKYTVSTIIS